MTTTPAARLATARAALAGYGLAGIVDYTVNDGYALLQMSDNDTDADTEDITGCLQRAGLRVEVDPYDPTVLAVLDQPAAPTLPTWEHIVVKADDSRDGIAWSVTSPTAHTRGTIGFDAMEAGEVDDVMPSCRDCHAPFIHCVCDCPRCGQIACECPTTQVCVQHGRQQHIGWDSHSGFGAGRVYVTTLACGCTEVDDQTYAEV